jgi:hypothetical protein
MRKLETVQEQRLCPDYGNACPALHGGGIIVPVFEVILGCDSDTSGLHLVPTGLDTPKEFGQRNLKSESDFLDVYQRQIALATFDSTHISPI